MDLIDDESLDDLRLDDRRGDFKHWLVFEKNPSFRNRPDIAGEPKVAEIMQEIIGEEFLTTLDNRAPTASKEKFSR